MRLLIDLASLAVVFVASVRVVTIPAERWSHGRMSKAAWVTAALWWLPVVHGVLLPIGTALALGQARRVHHRPTRLEPPPVPYAQGDPAADSDQERWA